jgi:hypothetical protein
MSVFLPTYKYRYEDYNAEDVLLVNQPPSVKRLLTIKMQSGEEERKVKCATTPSPGDCLVRVYDGGFTYGVIIAPFDKDFISKLRLRPYRGVVIAYGDGLDGLEVLSHGYDGLLSCVDRKSMTKIVGLFGDVLKMHLVDTGQRQGVNTKKFLKARKSSLMGKAQS